VKGEAGTLFGCAVDFYRELIPIEQMHAQRYIVNADMFPGIGIQVGNSDAQLFQGFRVHTDAVITDLETAETIGTGESDPDTAVSGRDLPSQPVEDSVFYDGLNEKLGNQCVHTVILNGDEDVQLISVSQIQNIQITSGKIQLRLQCHQTC